MARPLRIQYPGAVYHVTNRGNERKPIFKDDQDRVQFLEIIAQSIDTYNIRLHSFVLMLNHFHLLIETPLGNLGEFMRHFNITYTSYFNRAHKRVGHLYQGRYKSFLVEKDPYLSMVSRYIHLNPVKVGVIRKRPVKEQLAYLWQFKWSSLPGFLSPRFRYPFVEYRHVLEEYGGDNRKGRAAYRKQLGVDFLEGLQVKERIVGQSLLGRDAFVSRIKEQYLAEGQDRERPAIDMLYKHVAGDKIFRVLEKELETPANDIIATPGLNRQIAMDVLYRLGGLKNQEIGKMMGIDYSTVSQGRKRLRHLKEQDKQLREIIRKIEQHCQE